MKRRIKGKLTRKIADRDGDCCCCSKPIRKGQEIELLEYEDECGRDVLARHAGACMAEQLEWMNALSECEEEMSAKAPDKGIGDKVLGAVSRLSQCAYKKVEFFTHDARIKRGGKGEKRWQ